MEELIRSKHLKLTKGRLEILTLMNEAEVPMSADEVYAKIPRSVCSSLSTVYRVLNQLTEKGLLHSSLKQNGITYYQKASDEHRHYITCSECGKIVALENCPMDAVDNYIKKDTGYEITGHIFELTGICPDCKKK